MLEIVVPATSANVGPGFDCLGIALNIYNKFYIEEIDEGLIISGCEDDFKNKDNLIYKSMQYFFKKVKPSKVPKGLKINIQSDIPVSRGLGSSATCIVAGILAANYLSDSNLGKDKLLEIATDIEGHPDNIAPAIFGNMISSLIDDGKVHYNVIKVPNELRFCAIIPNFRLSTEKARAVLPKNIDHVDGVYNISRVSLLISSLINKNFDLIKIACQDKMHQNYRGPLIENYYDIVDEANRLNSLGVFLSGAGPTIMCMIKDDNKDFIDNMNFYLSNLKSKWDIKDLQCDTLGAVLNVL